MDDRYTLFVTSLELQTDRRGRQGVLLFALENISRRPSLPEAYQGHGLQ